jgi:hypothetical protein
MVEQVLPRLEVLGGMGGGAGGPNNVHICK